MAPFDALKILAQPYLLQKTTTSTLHQALSTHRTPVQQNTSWLHQIFSYIRVIVIRCATGLL